MVSMERNERFERIAKAREMRGAGKSFKEIAQHFGVAEVTVRAWVPPRPSTETMAKMQALRLQGLSNAAIARELGVSRQHVSSLLGPMDVPQPGRDVAFTIRLSYGARDQLRAIAKAYGLVNVTGPDPENGSVPKLMEAIGRGELVVIKPDQPMH